MIGIYERLLTVACGEKRTTSLAAELQLAADDDRCYHVACYEYMRACERLASDSG